MRTLIFVAALASLVLAGCGDNLKPARADAAVDDAPTVDAAPQAIGPCLDRPTEITHGPSGQLPCELISPGFQP